MAKSKKQNWIVRIKATVIKDVYVEGCTASEAEENPFNHATDEREVEQIDYEVQSVKPVE